LRSEAKQFPAQRKKFSGKTGLDSKFPFSFACKEFGLTNQLITYCFYYSFLLRYKFLPMITVSEKTPTDRAESVIIEENAGNYPCCDANPHQFPVSQLSWSA